VLWKLTVGSHTDAVTALQALTNQPWYVAFVFKLITPRGYLDMVDKVVWEHDLQVTLGPKPTIRGCMWLDISLLHRWQVETNACYMCYVVLYAGLLR
jgi:hypothetical protein